VPEPQWLDAKAESGRQFPSRWRHFQIADGLRSSLLTRLECSLFVLMMKHQPIPSTIASVILSAPAWERLALAVRNPRLRERAAVNIAERIAMMDDEPESDPRQLPLL
jgi:hypothetical protein